MGEVWAKYQKTEKQETPCREPVQPAEFQFLKKTGTEQKTSKFGKIVCKCLDDNMRLSETQKSV